MFPAKKAIRGGHAEHIHHNCDCTYAIRFDGKSDVDGYDPDALYDEYINAGDTPQERINALRRRQYAANPEKYRAQKRAAYARSVSLSKEAIENQEKLLKKYGNLEAMMIKGTSEDLDRWSELTRQTGLSEKDIMKNLSKDADNWETILRVQTPEQLQRFTDQLLETATDAELGALNLWSGETYSLIQRYTRYGVQVDEISRNAADNIEKLLAKMKTPEEIIVRRGTGINHIFEKMPSGWREDPSLLVGHSFTDKGFTATSPFEKGGFSGDGKNHAELFIKVPKGSRGAYIETVAHNELEKEFLLQKGYSYRIIKAEYVFDNPYFPEEPKLRVYVEIFKK